MNRGDRREEIFLVEEWRTRARMAEAKGIGFREHFESDERGFREHFESDERAEVAKVFRKLIEDVWRNRSRPSR